MRPDARLMVLLGLLLVPREVNATAVPHYSLKNLVELSDTVVLGRVISVADAGSSSELLPNGSRVTGRMQSATISVEQVVVGPPGLSLVQVQFLVPAQFTGYSGVVLDMCAMYFLKGQGAGFRFATPYRPYVAASCQVSLSSREPLARVAEVTAATFADASVSSYTRSSALHELSEIPGVAIEPAVRRALADRDQEVRLAGLYILIKRDGVKALPTVERHLEGIDQRFGMGIQNVASALSEIRDEAAVPTFDRLFRTAPGTIRGGIARALIYIKSPAVMPLLRLGLDDSEQEVRFQTMQALAERTGHHEMAPSGGETIEGRDSRYIEFWKDWFARQR